MPRQPTLKLAAVRRIIDAMQASSVKPVAGWCYVGYPHPDLEGDPVVQDLAETAPEEKRGA